MRAGLLVAMLLLCGCAGQQSTQRAIDGAKDLTARWQRLSDIQQKFLLGYTQAAQGRFQDAIAQLQHVRGHYPLLDDYIFHTLSRAAVGAGNLALAKEAASALSEQGDSRLRSRVEDLWIDIAIADKDWSDAEQRIHALIQNADSEWARRDGLLRLAALELQRGRPDEAGRRYLELYRSAQYPDHIATARQGLRAVERAGGAHPLNALPSHVRYDIARDFLNRSLHREAARLLAGIPGVAPLELADAYFRARQYPKAANIYADLASPHGSDMALLERAATAAARAGRDTTAIALQEAIIARNASATTTQRARYKRAFLLLDHGDYAAAVTAYHEWLRVARGSAASHEVQDALWAIAWAEYQRKNTDAALAAFSELENMVGADRLWRARIAYWRGRVLEQGGRSREAKAQWNDVVLSHSGSYYGYLAATRLHGKKSSDRLFLHPAFKAHPDTRRPLPIDGMSEKAAELARLGLWEEAIEEVEYQYPDRTPLLPIHQLAITQFANAWGLDPQLVLRLMWQESANRPQVVSPVGAIGLMQLMPQTAAAMARQLQLTDFRTADLFRPFPNIRVGMWYLHLLKERYAGSIPHMLASYNAGEAAVDRWRKKRADHDIEEFIETIPFNETRNYVRRILQMYW